MRSWKVSAGLGAESQRWSQSKGGLLSHCKNLALTLNEE